jgi:uncharacterized membrane protein YbaN (DUF454 family)
MATAMMASGGAIMMIVVRPLWVPLAVIAIMTTVGVWLWRRPEQAPS